MGHTAIPILMAVLSYCVWENVEVRATQSGSFLTMAHWNFAVCLSWMSVWTLGQNVVFYFFLLHVDITHATHTVASISISPYCWHAPLSGAGFYLYMHPRAPSYVNKSNDTQRPHRCSDGDMIWNANTVIRNECHSRGITYKRFHNDVAFSIFGSLRQVWACIRQWTMSHRPYCTEEGWRSNPVPLYPIRPCQSKKSACIRPFLWSGASLEQDGVVRIHLLLCFAFDLYVKNEKISFVLQGILVHHCQISWICLPWIRMLIGSPYRRAWLWYITGHPVCVSVIQSVLVRDMGVILSASVSINS